jgi:hypothetical protein
VLEARLEWKEFFCLAQFFGEEKHKKSFGFCNIKQLERSRMSHFNEYLLLQIRILSDWRELKTRQKREEREEKARSQRCGLL